MRLGKGESWVQQQVQLAVGRVVAKKGSAAVAIVVPIYNEVHRLGVVRDFLAQLINEAQRASRKWHIVLVDDGSWDAGLQRRLRDAEV